MPTWSKRSGFACIVLASLVAGGGGFGYLSFLGPGAHAAAAAYYDRFPDLETPEYPLFLRGIAERTPPGATIAIVVPRAWSNGYAYAFYRAVYLLPGRRVVPALTPDNKPIFENLRDAEYVAAWKLQVAPAAREIAWSGAGGTLYRLRDAQR